MSRSVCVVLAAVLAAGCANVPSASVASPSTPGGPSAPPPSASPPAAQPTASPTAVFDLVWFSDSSVDAAELLAPRIEQALGVEVRIHDFWGPATRGSAVFIAEMTEVEAVEQALVDAEMIVLYANPALTEAGDKTGEVCIPPDPTPRDPPPVFTSADFEPFAERLRFIYDRIFYLRGARTRTVIIRAVDAYVASLSHWKLAGIEPECTADWEAWTSTARAVAAEFGVPMASMYDAFNGPNHDEDPLAKGLLGPDRMHPSAAGSKLQVDVLDALGYAPVGR